MRCIALGLLLTLASCATPRGGAGGIYLLKQGQPAPVPCVCLDREAAQANEAMLLTCERLRERKVACVEPRTDWTWTIASAIVALAIGFAGGFALGAK